MTVTIYHNPSCSKSRQTLDLIRGKGISPKIIEYLNSELTQSEIYQILELLESPIRDIIRSGENIYQELNLDDPALTEDQLIQAIIEHPRLLQRPIVINQRKAAIGRPPEKVLEII